MPEISESKYLVSAGWADVPHIDAETARKMLAETMPHLREARSKGIPSLGQGAIYPIAESEFVVQPFKVPDHYTRGYGFDVGWNRTAAAFTAHDREQDVIYVTSEHYRGQAEPSTHAAAILARGKWLQGNIDPASRGRSQKDGEQLIVTYMALGLNLHLADNGVDAGLLDVFLRLSTGRLKVFATCMSWLNEYRLYRRDKHGHIVKQNDHLMDCFTGDTLVMTDEGPRPISTLAGSVGLVRTTGGKLAPYSDCRMYGANRKIVRLTFDDGSEVRCTADHLFRTPSGWVKAVDLAGMQCDTYGVSDSAQGGNLCSSPSYLRPSRSSKASAITSAGNTSSAMGAGFMCEFGVECTDDVRSEGSTSITWMRIEQTISRKTWRKSLLAGTSRITSLVMSAGYLLRRLSQPLRGMAQKMGQSGISGIMPSTPIFSTGAASGSATTAISRTKPLTGQHPVSVPTLANRQPVAPPGSTTSIGNAPSVIPSSVLIDTQNSTPAHRVAQRRCVSVVAAGRADVYCLTVPTTEAFLLANGVEVHNCTRYACRPTSIARMTLPPSQSLVGRSGSGNIYR